MDARVSTLVDVYRLNTRLLHQCLDGLTADQAAARPLATVNSVAFVAAHLADTRFALLGWLAGGPPLVNPLAELLGDARGIDDVPAVPPVPIIVAAWDTVSAALLLRLGQLTAAELDAPSPQRFPGAAPTLLGAIGFLAQHDSYHIGQLALLRKAAGLPAMRYGGAAAAAAG